MAMIRIGKDGFLTLNANEIVSVEFTPRGWDGYGARGREVPGKTIIEMRTGTRHTLTEMAKEAQEEFLARIQEAQT